MENQQAASARNIQVPQINIENVFLYGIYTSITVNLPLGSTRLANCEVGEAVALLSASSCVRVCIGKILPKWSNFG